MSLIPEDRSGLSPMMQQYLDIKNQHSDQILMFRLGDFYEMFFDDAVTASRELELTLTGRDCGLESRAPMCGVPYHSVDNYIARLVKKGYKVAICEQLENPALAKGMVKRDIVRVITPGTLMESNMLEEGANNYIGSLYCNSADCGIAFADISTGSVFVTQVSGEQEIINELGKYSPNEIIYHSDFQKHTDAITFIKDRLCCAAENGDDAAYQPSVAESAVLAQFRKASITELQMQEMPLAVSALGGLLAYLKETQRTGMERLLGVNCYLPQQYMKLDVSARRNLELTETMRSREKKGSLLWVLDKTCTAMGRRLLRTCIEQPLLSVTTIVRRQNAVMELTQNSILVSRLREALDGVYDLERLMTRVVYGNPIPKDLIALGLTTRQLPSIRELLEGVQSSQLQEIYANIDLLQDVGDLITAAIDEDSNLPLKEGGVIRDGFDSKLDEARHLSKDIKGIIASMEEQEKEKTGIRTLRIGYNRVFGYYIEVSNSFKDQVPEEYIRKQTLTNCERYITQEIKDLEERVLHAQENIIEMTARLYEEVRVQVASQLDRIQRTAEAVSVLDLLCSFATVALQNNYCCPTVDLSDIVEINEGRHPVVEQMLDGAPFVPNDTKLNNTDGQIAIITGPNMAGKSTYMRQTALIVLMAQMGSFVPATSAHIGIVDGIYTRVGASDDLSMGQSTFMVEMSEVASILHSATSKSLLILDEIGRGTSTYDGMSIARAVIEYIADRKKLGAKTLFATHYHELTEMEELIPCVKNYNVAVKKRGEDIVFLRRIIPGGVDESYGIEVSKLAGIPRWIIDRAYEVLDSLENGDCVKTAKIATNAKQKEGGDQLFFVDEKTETIKKRLRQADPNTLTPLEALNLIYELKKML